MPAYQVDNKKRIRLPEASPGEVYDVEYIGGGHYRLARMRREAEPKAAELKEDTATLQSDDET